VLELEPTEAESLPFARLEAPVPALAEVDARLRREGLERTLDAVDRALLRRAGLIDTEIRRLRGIWHRLADRRRARRH
jgi:hypothetical protein